MTYKICPILIFLCFGFHLMNAQISDVIDIGKKHSITSKVLNEQREYWVSLPESYQIQGNEYKKYPVLIILDGRSHFKHISGMVNYMSTGYNGNRRIPEMIVVAIKNINRRRDFTPDKIITKRANDSGGGETFLQFLENELIPKLDNTYRTNSYRILFGHSLGGLLATHAYMKDESKFNAFIAVDPSFGTWDAETMDKKLEQVTENSFKRYIYFATANWGKRNDRNRHRHVRLFEKLNSKCMGEFHARLTYFENENHGSIPPIAFYNGISSIFHGYGISYREVKSIPQLKEHYQSISSRLSFTIDPPEVLVNRIGYQMLNSRNEDENAKALSFFLLNVETYPNSYNAFDSLAEAYEAQQNIDKAIVNYKKSLKLNPNNINAKSKIEALKN